MSERNNYTAINGDKINCCNDREVKEAVCIHTDKVFDSCRELDRLSYIPSKTPPPCGVFSLKPHNLSNTLPPFVRANKH